MRFSDRLAQWLAGEEAAGLTGLEFAFGVPLATWVCLLFLVLAAAATLAFYWPRLAGLPPRTRKILVVLRTLGLVLACFLLLDPGFVGARLSPANHFVLLLFDDSRSMAVPMREGLSRGEALKKAYAAALDEFERPLRNRYQLAMYRFGETTLRIRNLAELTFQQRETRHHQAIEKALADFRGVHVDAVILFSDGVEQPGPSSTRETVDGVPVFTVGVGSSDRWRDLLVDHLTYSRSRGDGAPVIVKLGFSAEGMAGAGVVAEIVAGQKVWAAKTLAIDTDEEKHEVRLEFQPEDEGWLEFQVRLRETGRDHVSEAGAPAVAGDWVPQNNARALLVDNRRHFVQVLYFSGRPNWENKFILRALETEKLIQVTNVLRISAAETKFVYRGKKSSLVNPLFEGFYEEEADQPRYDESVFLRFGGDAAAAGRGFPETAEALFAYDLVILGDIEAGFFSLEQLDLLREFIRKRGGTLLLLGGPHAFSEGDYHGTLIENLLPVLLAEKPDRQQTLRAMSRKFKAQPTMVGLLSGAWNLHPNPDDNDELWRDLPPLTGLNRFPLTRAGANVHARVVSEDAEVDGALLYAQQRYGEGRTAVLATGSSWSWHLATEVNDSRHGRFWRQLVRGLSWDTPEPAFFRNKRDVYAEGAPVSMETLVRDNLFDEQSGMAIRLTLRDPLGVETVLPVDESLGETGLYTAQFTPKQPGAHHLNLAAVDDQGVPIATMDEAIMVSSDQEEYRHARFNSEFLHQLAQRHGGAYVPLEQLTALPERLPWLDQNQAERVRVSFWHFPGFLLILVALLATEWFLRRKRGFA